MSILKEVKREFTVPVEAHGTVNGQDPGIVAWNEMFGEEF